MTMLMNEQLAKRAEQLPYDARRIASLALGIRASGILVCDRNARPIGYALERIIEEQHTSQAMPPLWYARVSKRVDQASVSGWIERELESKPPIDGDTVLVVDDHISNGTTKMIARRSLAAATASSVNVHLATLTGRGSDTTLYPAIGSAIGAPWRDRGDVIGYDYNTDGSVTPVPTDLSRAFYHQIDAAMKQVPPRLN